MKFVLAILVSVAVPLAIGFGICKAHGANPHPAAMIAAGAVSLAAGELGILPLLLVRRSAAPEVLAVWRAAFFGTVLHLLVVIVLGAAVVLTKLVWPNLPFAYWIFVGYWASLLAVVGSVLYIAPASGKAASTRPPVQAG